MQKAGVILHFQIKIGRFISHFKIVIKFNVEQDAGKLHIALQMENVNPAA